jgi:hypothetical protein
LGSACDFFRKKGESERSMGNDMRLEKRNKMCNCIRHEMISVLKVWLLFSCVHLLRFSLLLSPHPRSVDQPHMRMPAVPTTTKTQHIEREKIEGMMKNLMKEIRVKGGSR